MTSRNSFSKLFKDNFKRRLWLVMLMIIAYVVIMPLGFLMGLQNWVIDLNIGNGMTKADVLDMVSNFLSSRSNEVMILCVIIFAVVAGIQSFSYLFSKREVDFYHGLPIKRDKLFAVNYLTGLLVHSVIIFVGYIFCILISIGHGFFDGAVFGTAMSSVLNYILAYWLVYNFAVVAVMLTGNRIVAFLGTAVLCLYGAIIAYVSFFCKVLFFSTIYSIPGATSPWHSYLSPYFMINKLVNYEQTNVEWVVLILTIVISLVLSVVLYKLRKSEAAEKSIAFNAIKKPLQVLLCVPASVLVGISVSQMYSGEKTMWLYIGVVLAAIISYMIVEVVYELDIKAILKLNVMTLVVIALSVGAISVYKFDLFGYDRYVPKNDQVAHAAVELSPLHEYETFYLPKTGHYMSKSDHVMKYMKIEDVDSVIELAKIGVETLNPEYAGGKAEWFNTTIHYTLKSGKIVSRYYSIPYNTDTKELFNDIFSQHAYKEGAYGIYELEEETPNHVDIVTGLNTTRSLALEHEEIKRLVDIYKDDLSNMSLNEAYKLEPVAMVELRYYRLHNNEDLTIRIPILDVNQNTIKYLEEIAPNVLENTDIDEINSIRIENHQGSVVSTISDDEGESDLIYKLNDYVINTAFENYTLNPIEGVPVEEKLKEEAIKDGVAIEENTLSPSEKYTIYIHYKNGTYEVFSFKKGLTESDIAVFL